MTSSSSVPRVAADVEAARAIAAALAEAGTEVIFGVPGGGGNLALVDACGSAGLKFVLAHGETAAAIMAGTYGELTGRPGACVVTRGPGAASVVNGVAQAQLDRVPLVVVTDGIAHADRQRVTHQLIDHRALLAPVTKWSGEVGRHGEDVARAAVRVATLAPPGAVHLDVVADAVPSAPYVIEPAPKYEEDLERTAAVLAGARHIVLAVGVGARAHAAEIRRLVREAPWPVLTTYKAKGVVPESWPNAAGLLTGGTIEAPVLSGADVVVALGLDPVELIPAPWPYDAPVLALGEWPLRSTFLGPAVELVGPLADLLEFLRTTLPAPRDSSTARHDRLAAERTLCVPTDGLAPHDVVAAVRRRAPATATATVDSGAHMLVAMALWEVEEPGRALISSGLATMGFALPAAIAAALVRPHERVVCFVGDGGLGMVLAELETVARLELRLTVVVFNDGSLSLIEIKQRPGASGGAEAVRYAPTDFAAAAEALGMPGRRVHDVHELETALETALALDGPMLIDAAVDPSGYGAVLAAVRG